jgi:hypothetical protein
MHVHVQDSAVPSYTEDIMTTWISINVFQYATHRMPLDLDTNP